MADSQLLFTVADTALTEITLDGFRKVAEGKVRNLYEVDAKTLLFVASDRISAYDVIMANGIPCKGVLLTLLSAHWFQILQAKLPPLRHHFLTLDLPPSIPPKQASVLQYRSMQVREIKVFPVEVIIRGYITGSAWQEYKRTSTVHGLPMPAGLLESQAFPQGPIYTPSTKAAPGLKDENITPARASDIIGVKYARRVELIALAAYDAAREYAAARGIIIADTKFEFGLDEERDEVVMVDEVLTPDSSRFWPLDRYAVGREQESYDKQFLRDWLVEEGLKGKQGVRMTSEVVNVTAQKYREAFERLTGRNWLDAVKGW